MTVSSHVLSPEHGARFVFLRAPGERLEYAASIHAADGQTLTTTLSWGAEGELIVAPEIDDLALREAVVKLARPLRSKAPARMTRWRALG